MNSSAAEILSPRIQSVAVSDDTLSVDLVDGRTISVPTVWYPRLAHATAEERKHWRLIGQGEGIHWPDLDEDISIDNLLWGRPSGESHASLKRWLAGEQAPDRMKDLQELRENIEQALGLFKPWIEAVSTVDWKPEQGFFSLIKRAIIRRQWEFLGSAAFLAQGSRGYAAVPFLRPACEEAIWLKYLLSLQESDAEELIRCLIHRELSANMAAQRDYAGANVFSELGLEPYLRGLDQKSESVKRSLQNLGKKLQWDTDMIRKGRLPSARFLAKETNLLPFYDFLYHGSSRFVHFSCVELGRRAWGTRGEVSVASEHYLGYWSSFALRWGMLVFVETFNLLQGSGEFKSEEALIDTVTMTEVMERIGNFPQVPLITTEELLWRDER